MKKATFASAILFASSVLAAEPKLIGNFGKWSAYKADGICFIVCQPEKSEGNYSKRDDAFLMVSHRPNDNVKGEVSSILGFPLNTKAESKVFIDGKEYGVHTTEQAVFVEDDATFVSAMKKGGKLELNTVSTRGTKVKDTYPLTGFTKANEAAAKACR